MISSGSIHGSLTSFTYHEINLYHRHLFFFTVDSILYACFLLLFIAPVPFSSIFFLLLLLSSLVTVKSVKITQFCRREFDDKD